MLLKVVVLWNGSQKVPHHWINYKNGLTTLRTKLMWWYYQKSINTWVDRSISVWAERKRRCTWARWRLAEWDAVVKQMLRLEHSTPSDSELWTVIPQNRWAFILSCWHAILQFASTHPLSTSVTDCLERLISEMTYYVSRGTLKSTHSLTHSLCRNNTYNLPVYSHNRNLTYAWKQYCRRYQTCYGSYELVLSAWWQLFCN